MCVEGGFSQIRSHMWLLILKIVYTYVRVMSAVLVTYQYTKDWGKVTYHVAGQHLRGEKFLEFHESIAFVKILLH